jgi:hypothetical protein
MAQIRQEIPFGSKYSLNNNQSSQIVQLDTNKYNGTVTYYFEVLGTSSPSSDVVVSLYDVAATSNVVSVTMTGSSMGLFRSNSFTPTAGAREYKMSSGSLQGNVVNGRIIIIQNATTFTNTQTQIEIGPGDFSNSTTTTTDTALTNPKYWKYDASKWDGTLTVYFESTFLTGTSKSAATMTLQTSTSITAPSWSNVASSAVTTTSTTATRVRSGAITLVDGNWYRAVMKAGNSKSGITTYNAKVIIDQTSSPTKLEPQYLLANTLFAAGTGLQTFLTKWDSTEWDAGAGSISYYFQAEAANDSTSDVELWEADGGGSGLGVLTNIDNAQISSAVTMPTSQNMDTKATTNAGDVAAARILVTYVFSAAAPSVGGIGGYGMSMMGCGAL